MSAITTAISPENGVILSTESPELHASFSSEYVDGILTMGTLTDVVVNGIYLELARDPEAWMPGGSDIVPAMSSAINGVIQVLTTDQYSANYPAWKAFDNVGSTAWRRSGSGSLTIDIGAGAYVHGYSVASWSTAGYETEAPKDWTLEGSNDNSTWTVLDTISSQTGWIAGEKRIFELPVRHFYRYYRINVSATNGASILTIGEFELLPGINAYKLTGNRVGSPIALNGLATNLYIHWNETGSADTALAIKTAITDSDTAPDTALYIERTQMEKFVADGTDLTGKYLWIKAEFATSNNRHSPALSSIAVNIPTIVYGTLLFEMDITTAFNSPAKKTVSILNVQNDREHTAYFADVKAGFYYWRTRIETQYSEISAWTETREITLNYRMKRSLYNLFVAAYNQNLHMPKKRALYHYEGVAKAPLIVKNRALYGYENITSDPPFPFIERLSTTRAAKGSIVTLYGNGFGAKPEEDPVNADRAARGYGGFVYLGEQICNIIEWSWQKIVFQTPGDGESGAVKVALTVPEPPGIRVSNLIGFEIYEAEQPMDIGMEFFVCDRNNPNTILCQMEHAASKSFQMILNNPGSGKFSISRYDAKGGNRDYLADQNFILCRVDGVDLFKWIIESIRPVYVDNSEQQMIEVSGRGILSMLERAVVYPEGMPTPVSLERIFTAAHGGAILRQLILEAQARGVLTGLVITWTADADSIGNPWTDVTNISFHAGTPILEVVTKLTEGMGLFDIEITPSMQLKIYKSKGIDKSEVVRYFPGQAIISHENQNDTARMTNVVLVEGESGGLVEVIHPTAGASWGRREGYLQARNVPNECAQLENYGNLYLKKAAEVNWGIRGTVSKFITSEGSRMVPFESYLIGDWIGWYIPPEGSDTIGFDEKVRVKGITVEEQSDSEEVLYTLDLNNVLLEHEIKVSQMVERMSMFSRDTVLSSQSTEAAASIVHNHTHGLLTGLGEDDHPQYFNEERHAADSHSAISRVSGIKKSGEDVLTGEVTFVAGSNISLIQDDAQKTITFSSTGGGSGGIAIVSELPADAADGTAVMMITENSKYFGIRYSGAWYLSGLGFYGTTKNILKPEVLYSMLTGSATKSIVAVSISTDFTSALRIKGIVGTTVNLLGSFSCGAGKGSIWLGAESEANYDYTIIYIDNVQLVRIEGIVVHKYVEFDITAGTHSIKIEYRKDGSGDTGYDGSQIYGIALPI